MRNSDNKSIISYILQGNPLNSMMDVIQRGLVRTIWILVPSVIYEWGGGKFVMGHIFNESPFSLRMPEVYMTLIAFIVLCVLVDAIHLVLRRRLKYSQNNYEIQSERCDNKEVDRKYDYPISVSISAACLLVMDKHFESVLFRVIAITVCIIAFCYWIKYLKNYIDRKIESSMPQNEKDLK